MPTVQQLADWCSDHLTARGSGAAGVLAGPKRETWISSEMFAAVSSHVHRPTPYDFPDFACYGEQEYRTLMPRLRKRTQAFERDRPDLVVFDPSLALPGGNRLAITVLVENKLFLPTEDSGRELKKLEKQLAAARAVCPRASVAGFVWALSAPCRTPGDHARFVKSLKARVEKHLPSPRYDWLRSYEFRSVLSHSSGLPYPAMHVALEVGVRVAV